MRVKYVGSFCTEERYMLIGIEAKNDDKVLKKINQLERLGIYYDGVYSPIRKVDKIPDYVDLKF